LKYVGHKLLLILQLFSVVGFSRSIHCRWRITLQDNDCRWQACAPRLPTS